MVDSKIEYVTVFGGTGFLGQEVVKQVIADGIVARVAVRHPERFACTRIWAGSGKFFQST